MLTGVALETRPEDAFVHKILVLALELLQYFHKTQETLHNQKY